jgi:outer membrane protein TolC
LPSLTLEKGHDVRHTATFTILIVLSQGVRASATDNDALSIADITRPISLAEAVRLASSRNLSVRRAAAAVEQARASYNAKLFTLLPSATASVEYTVHSYGDQSAPGIVDGHSALLAARHSISGTATLSVPLLNARIWKSISTAEFEIGLAQADEKRIRQLFLLEVFRYYFLCRASQNLIMLYKAQEVFAGKHLESAMAKRDVGLGTNLDVLRARGEVRRVEQQLLSARGDLMRSAENLRSLLNVQELPLPDDTDVIMPAAIPSSDIDGAAQASPDVAIARVEVNRADATLQESRVEFAPSLAAILSGTYQPTDPAISPAGDHYLSAAVVKLTIPLFDPLTIGALHSKKAALAERKLALEESLVNARGEIRRFVLSVQNAQSHQAIAEDQSLLAQAALEEALILYKVGKISSLELIDATRTQEESKASVVQRQLELAVTRAELAVAVGLDLNDVAKAGQSR